MYDFVNLSLKIDFMNREDKVLLYFSNFLEKEVITQGEGNVR